MVPFKPVFIFSFILLFVVQPTTSYSFVDSEEALIRGKWRAGEFVFFKFEENVITYENGVIVSDETYTTRFMAEIAATRGNEGFVMLWQFRGTDASLFGDALLDQHMYGILADGVVVHTDFFGGFRHISNLESLHAQLKNAVGHLDERNHWTEREELREYIQYYIEEPELFGDILTRDMRFLFGMHGVQLIVDEEYTYQTWQQNPWGEPMESTGNLSVLDYDQSREHIHILNKVEQNQDTDDSISLMERQRYKIDLSTGWPLEVELRDEIKSGTYQRVRTVFVTKFEY